MTQVKLFLYGTLLLVAIIALNSLVFNCSLWLIANQEHANSRHTEAQFVRDTYQNKVCEGTEFYFSPTRGTVLILCGIRDTQEWGGLIFRVTENNGSQWLGDECYECSVFMADRKYWNKVISRDAYIPLYMRLDIERMFREWFGS